MALVTIGVQPARQHQRLRRLFAGLERTFPVAFQGRELGDCEGLEALVLLDAAEDASLSAARRGIPCFAKVHLDPNPVRGSGNAIQFGSSHALPTCLCGRALADSEGEEAVPLVCQPGDEVLASRDGHALWVYRRGEGAGIHRVSLSPPELGGEEVLWNHFHGERFFRLLPLIHFLQTVTRCGVPRTTPLRACLVLDDPNLRRMSYGCVNYRELAWHARKHHYHAAIALVPLDMMWTSRGTSAFFREQTTHLSLVIHGNNHTLRELAVARQSGDRLALLAQALRRAQKLERQHGLEVCRVMEAPHGIIDREMFEPLVALGYEAALITPEHFLRHNRIRPSSDYENLDLVRWSPGGLGCIPRIRLSRSWRNETVLAALLGQPIVLAGHHYDARHDMDFLAEVAGAINGLGQIRWSNLSDVARSCYEMRQDGTTAAVKMRSRRVVLPVPENTQTFTVERPWLAAGRKELLILKEVNGESCLRQEFGNMSDPIPLDGVREIEIASPPPDAVDPAEVLPPRVALWPAIRRSLTEARDRAYPHASKLAWLLAWPHETGFPDFSA